MDRAVAGLPGDNGRETREEVEDRDTAELVARFQAGDREAFGALYMRYFDRVYSYLRVALNDRHGAEDLTQQVFANILQALPRYERRAGIAFRHWLFKLVRNEAIHELRKRGRIELTDPAELDTEREQAQLGEVAEAPFEWITDAELVMFVERLSQPQRQVLVLRYMLDLSYRDIAAILDRSPDDVRSLHSRGVRFLRGRLERLHNAPSERGRIRMRGFVKQPPVIAARRWALRG
jgi:RNA polymerase sigma-70 factor (ECF subfamily)